VNFFTGNFAPNRDQLCPSLASGFGIESLVMYRAGTEQGRSVTMRAYLSLDGLIFHDLGREPWVAAIVCTQS
jgi:hypothetical protein